MRSVFGRTVFYKGEFGGLTQVQPVRNLGADESVGAFQTLFYLFFIALA